MRNFLVWKRLIHTSVVTHIVEPSIILIGFGYGVGSLVQDVDGVSYLEFIAAGMVGFGIMNSASFEALFSAFSRMHVQKTWSAILNAPMTLDDVVLGEWLWATIKSMISGGAMLVLLILLGIAHLPHTVLVIPYMAIVGLAFAGIALAVNAMAHSYDFFSYYFSLFLTPMMLLSGAFFPVSTLPPALSIITQALPLYHAVSIFRPLIQGTMPTDFILHTMVLLIYGALGAYIALVLTRHRLLR